MSSVAFWNARKKQKRTPQVHFQLKEPGTLVFKLKYIFGDKTFEKYKRVGVRQYEMPACGLQRVVDICDANGWEVLPFPETVQRALDTDICIPFDTSFEQTHLWKCMFGYQKEGVKQVVTTFNGRALIGDEMGCGKTLQALACYRYYNHRTKTKTNLLIICPAYLKYTWKNEIEKWIPGSSPSVIVTGKDPLDQSTPLIVSYELAAKKSKELKKMKFGMVICDESHYLKSHKAKRTKNITPLVKGIQRAILLTGTPALNRPVEIFPQAHMLCSSLFPKYRSFTERYCDGKMSPIGFYDASGSSNSFELTWLLKKVLMIRRLKRDVLKDLPAKIRSEIHVPLKKTKEVRAMVPKFKRWKQLNEDIPKMVPCSDAVQKAAFERKTIISELFRMTAVAKVEVVKRIVKDMMDQGTKFIVFCFHKVLMDAVEEVCDSYIRIDGSTPQVKRQEYVDKFQTGDAQVAILSLLAASTGLTLTASSTMLFAELYFVPGTILQAEDRIHRIGARKSCDIRYLITENSLDSHIWKMLHYKIVTLDNCVDGRNDRSMVGKKMEWNGLDSI